MAFLPFPLPRAGRTSNLSGGFLVLHDRMIRCRALKHNKARPGFSLLRLLPRSGDGICIHRAVGALTQRLGSSVRGSGKALVCVYFRATAGVARDLQGMQECSNLGSESRGPKTPQPVGYEKNADPSKYTQFEEGP